jgi:hypothetical protein
MTYISQAAHYSGPKLLARLGMPAITVRAGRDGRLDLRARTLAEGIRTPPARWWPTSTFTRLHAWPW